MSTGLDILDELHSVVGTAVKYRAFFSYARADDQLANWLHKQLDSYRTPKNLVGQSGSLGPLPAKLYPIFRDRTDLQAGGQVDQSLQAALEDSECLIVLCTPVSAKSRWVNHECETFQRLGRTHRIFPVIAAGSPDIDDPDVQCFPPALRAAGLLAADLREIRLQGGQLVGDGREGGRLKLIAGLLGLPLDVLIQRERKRQMRTVAFLSAAAIGGVALAVTALASAIAATSYAAAERTARLEASNATDRATASEQKALGAAAVTEAQLAISVQAQDNAEAAREEAERNLSLAEDRLNKLRARNQIMMRLTTSGATSKQYREQFVRVRKSQSGQLAPRTADGKLERPQTAIAAVNKKLATAPFATVVDVLQAAVEEGTLEKDDVCGQSEISLRVFGQRMCRRQLDVDDLFPTGFWYGTLTLQGGDVALFQYINHMGNGNPAFPTMFMSRPTGQDWRLDHLDWINALFDCDDGWGCPNISARWSQEVLKPDYFITSSQGNRGGNTSTATSEYRVYVPEKGAYESICLTEVEDAGVPTANASNVNGC